MVGPAGPPATISREPGQARKGAAAAVTLCAGVWLVGFTSITKAFPLLIFRFVCTEPSWVSGDYSCLIDIGVRRAEVIGELFLPSADCPRSLPFLVSH